MNLKSLFYPQSVAVVGASRQRGSVGNDVLKNLIANGYQGQVYPVNPKATQLYNLKVYPDLKQIPTTVDLIVIATPAQFVPQIMKDAAIKNVQAAVVISAGFAESGNIELEKEVLEICQQHHIYLVGPNCLGLINPEIKLNASFASLMPKKGNIAFISQSGALCASVLDYAQEQGFGFSKFISIGNKVDIDELALIRYLKDDPQTKVILIYTEQLNNTQELMKLAQETTYGLNPKPIIILKAGKTSEGASATSSHTGALNKGTINYYRALFNQSGIIEAKSIEQLFTFAQVLSQNQIAPARRVTVITNAGGPGVIATDNLVASGLKLARLTKQTKKKLVEILPPAASVNNPVDILGDASADRYRQTLSIVIEDEHTDSILLILTPQSMTEVEATAQAIIDAKQKTAKPIIASFMGQASVREGVNRLRLAGVTATALPEPAARALAAFDQFTQHTKQLIRTPLQYENVDKQKVTKIFETAKQTNQTIFPEAQALEILKAYRFPLLKSKIAHNANQAVQVAAQIGGSLAMKINSPHILHESDVGGVMLDVTAANISEQFNKMMRRVKRRKPKAKLEGVLLMEMAPKTGIETIIGMSKQPGLEPLMIFGLGGIYVEVLKQVTYGIAPLTKKNARRMIDRLPSNKIFSGVRGQPPSDIDKIIECLGRLSQLVTDFPQITEVDINPLLVLAKGKGAKILDARIIVNHS